MNESSKREREEWERRPSAKRVNWEKVGSRWPFGEKGLWKAVAEAARRRSGALSPAAEEEVEAWLLASPLSSASTVEKLPPSTQASALIHVKLTAVRRGAFGAWAEVHLPSPSEREKWSAALLRAWSEEGSEDDQGRKELALVSLCFVAASCAVLAY